MTDTVPPPLPANVQGASQSAKTAAPPPLQGVLEGAPREIREALEQVRLQGQVKEAKPDGTIRVSTPRGEIDIRIPPSPQTPPPQTGAVVKIDLPPPNPGRPEAPRAVIVQAEQVQIKAPAPQQQPPKPVNVQIQPAPEPSNAPPPPPPLQVGDEVRLQPLPQTSLQDVQPIKPAKTLQTQLIPLPSGSPVIQGLINAAIDIPASITAKINVLQAAAQPSIIDILNSPEKTSPRLPSFSAPIAYPASKTAVPVLSAPALAPKPEDAITTRFSILPASFQGGFAPPPPIAGESQPVPGPLENFLLDATVFRPSPAQALSAVIEGLNAPQPQFFKPESQQSTAFFTPDPKTDITLKSDSTAILSPAKPGEITAKVTGVVQNTLPVVSFGPALRTADITVPDPRNSFIVYTPLAENIAQGSELILTPQNSAPASNFVNQPLPPLLPLTMLTPGPWPVMDEINQQLFLSTPQTAQAMHAAAPSPASPGQVMPAALFFIAAFKGGDLQSWLGEKAVETLRQSGKSNLLQRLTQEGGLLNRMGAEPVSQDWRALALPLSWQNEIHKIVIHYRHDEQREGSDQAGNKGTRFVIDLNLSRMGKVQIDALARPETLDFILRTEQPFSHGAQSHMRQLFASALEAENLNGSLSFQNKPEQWVVITADNEKFGLEA